eukprot:TRINITY_DN7785_c0_g1_i1.p2 TRINITY_DN7785_c0_g1~~TRINITY_DN7785_c0_g1_i1.p2  ORF type:complete len:268 (+),score=63.83 TRINITY_DN7785_c0_g1_i1:97-900(+)
MPQRLVLMVLRAVCVAIVLRDATPLAVLDALDAPALGAVAARGCCGRLTLRAEAAGDAVAEVAALLGVGAPSTTASVAEAHAGLPCAVVTTSAAVADAARGAWVPASDAVQLPMPCDASQAAALLLGHAAKLCVLAVCEADFADAASAVAFADSAVAALLGTPQPPYILLTALGRRDARAAADSTRAHGSGFRPAQSSETWRGAPVAVSATRGGIAASWCSGVTRLDGCQHFTEAEIEARGAAGALLADYAVAEVAFKLGQTPKYGA